MKKGLSIALLTAGIALTIYGINASNSLGPDVSHFFTGSPTDKTVWLLIGGLTTAIVGFFGFLRGPKRFNPSEYQCIQ